VSLLCCPRCKGSLTVSSDSFGCAQCDAAYPTVLGIPDFRVYADPLISIADDFRKAEKLEAQAASLSFSELVRYYWSLPTFPDTPPDLRQHFIDHVLSDEARVATYIGNVGQGFAFLDVGCGTAALTTAASARFDVAVGCDVAFRWLIVARKRLQEAGRAVNLVCCCADYLPFKDDVFDTVASVSLLEHVSDAAAVVRESGRVLKARGQFFCLTTNRFSLAPEPHVRVWGVGFLPRAWMARYVRFRRGLAYEKKRPLSYFELRRLVRAAGLGAIRASLPRVTALDLRGRSRLERLGARILNALADHPRPARPCVLVAPVIQLTAEKGNTYSPSDGAARP